MHGTLGVAFDLRAQPANVDVDRPWAARLVDPPHAIEQLAAAEGPARMSSEHRQELELLGAEVYSVSIASQLVGDQIELEAFGNLQAGAASSSSPVLEQRRTSGKLARIDRLRERFVVALAKRLDPGCGGLRRTEMDRPEGRAPAALGGDELDVAIAGRRHGNDRDPRPTVEEQIGKDQGIGDDPNARGDRGETLQLERRAIGGKDEPRRVSFAEVDPLIAHHPRNVRRSG